MGTQSKNGKMNGSGKSDFRIFEVISINHFSADYLHSRESKHLVITSFVHIHPRLSQCLWEKTMRLASYGHVKGSAVLLRKQFMRQGERSPCRAGTRRQNVGWEQLTWKPVPPESQRPAQLGKLNHAGLGRPFHYPVSPLLPCRSTWTKLLELACKDSSGKRMLTLDCAPCTTALFLSIEGSYVHVAE